MRRFGMDFVAAIAVVLISFGNVGVQTQGPRCGDERDRIVDEYVANKIDSHPGRPVVSCEVFHAPKDSQYFPWNYALNGTTPPRHTEWGWLNDDFLAKLDATYAAYYETYHAPLIGHGAWRCPEKNDAVDSPHLDSWHQFGQAIDISPVQYPKALRKIAENNGLQMVIENDHVHLELHD